VPTDREWLAAYKAELVRRDAAIRSLDRTKVEIDKKARALDVKWAKLYARRRPKLIKILDKLGIKEWHWCRTLGRGFAYPTIMRRIQILKGHTDYLRRREEVGDNGYYGRDYAAHLARPEKPDDATSSRSTRTQIGGETPTPDPDHQFFTSEAHLVLPKLPPQSAQVCITSPGYWPGRRLYNMLADGTVLPPTPDDIGHEPTWEGYLDHVVRRDFVILDDVIANPASIYGQQAMHAGRSIHKLASQINLRTQDTTKMRPKGNWLGLPWRFADAMMDDGWVWRDLIIWDKGPLGRKESTDSRCRHNFEYILMFTLSASGYWYNQDALRIPLSGGRPYTVTGGRQTQGVLRRDVADRDYRINSNPLGRVADAVWHVPPVNMPHGSHSAAFPEELARRCLLLGAPPPDMLPVATVIDIYNGSGTVAAVAKKMGLRSISIDINPFYTAEAQQRVQAAARDPGDPGAANDNHPTEEHDADIHEP
jgi:site-specific DNA-methyltransferase (cytosine-N4-specific)